MEIKSFKIVAPLNFPTVIKLHVSKYDSEMSQFEGCDTPKNGYISVL